MELPEKKVGVLPLDIELGCLSPCTVGVRRDCSPRHHESSGFADSLLNPWRMPQCAMSSDWQSLHDEMFARFSSGGSPGGLLLLGDSHLMDGVVASMKRLAGSFYWETDLTRCVDRWSANFLVGAEQGYVGYSPDGTEFTRKLEEMSASASAWSSGHRVHRPFPVLVFRNVHRACPEVQQMVESLATRGELSLPGGRRISVPRLLVVATAPGVLPRDTTPEGCKLFAANALDSRTRRHIFDQTLSASFFPLALRSPDLREMVAALSLMVGAKWSATLPPGTLSHRRIVAGPALLGEVFARAEISPSDRGWVRIWEKLERAAAEVLSDFPTPVLPPSLAVPLRWRVVAELESGKIWAEFRPEEEVAEMPVRISLPAPAAESLGVEVPPSEDWVSAGAEAWLSGQILGQEKTVSDIVGKIAHFSTALPRSRPLLSALLLGPTGTGKTLLSRKLAEAYSRPLVRLDCASLQDEGSLEEAIFGQHAESLATLVSTSPSSLVLLDEVEKAHPAVWFMLMQALDEGVLRSPSGRPDISLRKCVVVATSNQLSDMLGDMGEEFAGKPHAEADSCIRAALRMSGMVNEAVLERLDAVYLLAPLTGADSTALWGKILREDFALEASDEVLRHLAAQHEENGPSRGARAIRRACLEIQSRPGEWGVEKNGSTLSLRSPFTPVSRRARFWGQASENPTAFLSSCTHPWVAESLREVFTLNASKTHPSTPQALVMLCGPSGAGKSHLAAELARSLGKGDPEVVDCSAICAEELAPSVFGRPGCPGRLSSALLSRPDRVVVFDNVEKSPQGFAQKLVSVLHSGGYRDGATGEYIDARHAAVFMTADILPQEMQELCDSAAAGGQSARTAAVDRATAAVVASGLLSSQETPMLDLVAPFGAPTGDGIVGHSRRVIMATAREFGLGPEEAATAASMISPQTMSSLSTSRIRHEAARIFSGMSRAPVTSPPVSPSRPPACRTLDAPAECQA